MRIIAAAVLILLTLGMAQAEPRQSKERNHNYILRRQEAGLVSGVPTIRRIIGKREIDIYPNGLMFEKDNVVGVLPKRWWSSEKRLPRTQKWQTIFASAGRSSAW
jgi:hypothetical protein